MRYLARSMIWMAVVVCVVGAWAEGAEARELWIEDFHAEMEVEADGTVRVEERIRVHFRGSWNGILRYIPYRYQIRGVRGSIRLKLDAIEDDAGNQLEYWTSKRDGQIEFKIKVPGASNATRVVVIRYHADNVIRLYDAEDSSFGGHDELYWNVTGTGWPNRIEKASARVRLPEGVPADSIQTAIHVGTYRARGDRADRSSLTFEEDGGILFAVRDLGSYEGLTIVLGFEPGHVEHPTWLTKVGWFLQDNYFLLFPLLALLLWWILWRRFGKDDISDRTIIPEFEAPMGLRPGEVGIIADDHFDQHDMTASIIDLGVRGIVQIEYRGEDKTSRLHLDEGARSRAKLRPYEEQLVDGLFGSKDHVTVSSLKYKFYKKVPKIRTAAAERLVKEKFFHKKPSDVRAMWNVLTVVVIGVLFGIGLATSWPAPYWAALIICAIPMFVIARHMPRRTKKGLEALARTRGLEDYLETAEEARMRELPLSQLEALIPFAIALGVGDRWIEAFTLIYTEQPEWINTGGQPWTAHTLGRATDQIGSDVNKNLYSGPRAQSSGGSSGFGGSWSGGSGFSSGGGFSGGGFGGGGGGGW